MTAFAFFPWSHAASLRMSLAALILAASWLGLRHIVGARLGRQSPRQLMLDALPFPLLWVWLCCLLSRPLLASVVVCAMSVGLSFGNAAKRRSSNEPLVFADRSQGAIFFYPNLYADSLNGAWLLLGITCIFGLFGSLAYVEPPVFSSWLPPVLGTMIAVFAWRFHPSAASVVAWLGEDSAALCTFDPIKDAQRFGPICVTVLHASIAAVERPERRLDCRPGHASSLPKAVGCNGPIVMVQLESFFDARHHWHVAPGDLLPNFDRCAARADFYGSLTTPAWGANTVRTEFAVLTGLPPSVLGLDAYNPYLAFARAPVDSIAWRLKEAGYRTVCVHPFDRRFYGRHQVMPNLGFDEFLDIGDFTQVEQRACYIPDAIVVDKIEAVIREHGPKTFVFAITMGNHSPWERLASPLPAHASRRPLHTDRALEGYLAGLRLTDAALGDMANRLSTQWADGVLAVFGDHQPSLSKRYGLPGQEERTTDYLIMRARPGRPVHRNISAHQLPGTLLDLAASAGVPARAPAAVAN